MTQEARRFVSDLVWSDAISPKLFTADYGYLNGDLASIYGVSRPQPSSSESPSRPNSERAGLLGQAMFLALAAKPDETSPTARGLFVREQFLCQHVADPPPGVNTNLPPVTEAKPQTNRERLAEHATNKSCAGCHNLIDPIGFGFEKFDAIGARRDKLQLRFDRPSGEGERATRTEDRRGVSISTPPDRWPGFPNSTFTSPKELGAVLATQPAVPGMHGEAVFPLHRGPHGDAGRPAADPQSCWRISGGRNFGSKK